MKKYNLDLNESELFTLINALTDTRTKFSKTKSYVFKLSKMLDKLELLYFEKEEN